MDIGQKLKNARSAAGMKQEYVAEKIGVSRQTISNWENNKTYPDIISVIDLSDLYSISLDELLKGDKKMIEHLEESTNVVKSRRRYSKLILVISYLLIWAMLLILFWFGTAPDDAMGFALLALYIVLPITTIVMSIFIGKDISWGKWRWFISLLFGVMYMLMGYGTFSVANMISSDKINMPDLFDMIPGTVCSLFGLLIGFIILKLSSKSKKQVN